MVLRTVLAYQAKPWLAMVIGVNVKRPTVGKFILAKLSADVSVSVEARAVAAAAVEVPAGLN